MNYQLWIQDFPLGAPTCWWAPSADAGAFWQKRVRKGKNWVPLGEGAPAAPPESATDYRDLRTLKSPPALRHPYVTVPETTFHSK